MKSKNKKIIAYIIGTICFIPAYLVSIFVININCILASALLIITQIMWLTSITLITFDLDIENRQLKVRIKELENEK